MPSLPPFVQVLDHGIHAIDTGFHRDHFDAAYLIVEDGICHHGLDEGPAPGPYEAVETFLSEQDAFVLDRSRENFLITWNPKGFLKRVR